jgi:SAM-dependent methyltransferase
MGICYTEVKLLAAEAKSKSFKGTVATLGRQHVYVTESEAKAVFEHYGLDHSSTKWTLHREPTLAAKGYVSDDCLLMGLGFERVVRIDIDNYEQVDEILDLNDTTTPDRLLRAFDTIIDFGTLEHVYHIPNAMSHISRMIRPLGRVIHMLPASNCVEHGFYSFSPTFIRDHYLAAEYQIKILYLCKLPRRFERAPWTLYEYPTNFQDTFPIGRLGQGIFVIFAIVVAPEQPVIGSVPQQGFYRRTWENSAASDSPEDSNSKAARFVSMFSQYNFSKRVALSIVSRWRAFRSSIDRMTQGQVPLKRIGKL